MKNAMVVGVMRKFRYLCWLFMLFLCSSMSAYARADSSIPQVRGTMMRDFMRLTFEWSEPTLFTAKTSGNNVILTFDRKASPNMAAVLKKLHPYVVKAERKSDGKTIVLTLDKPHRIRTFVSDNISGIDVLDVKNGKNLAMKEDKKAAPVKHVVQHKDPALKLAKLAPSAGEEVAKEAVVPAPPRAEETKIETPVEPAQKEIGEAKAKDTPVAKVEESKPEDPKEVAKTEQKIEPVKEAAPAVSAPVPTGAIDEKPVIAGNSRTFNAGVSMVPMSVDEGEGVVENSETAKPVETKPVEEKASSAHNIEAIQDIQSSEPIASNKIVVSVDPDGATLRLPLKERTALAVFIRENILWVVLDKKSEFDLADFENLPQTVIGKASIFPHQQATILRIPVADNIYPTIKQQVGQLDVAILLSSEKKVPNAAVDITVNTDPPAPANIFIPVLEAGSNIEVTDPNIGDVLIITPFYTREQGIAKRYSFVDFSLLPSTQGLVVAKKADATEVTALRNGLRISLPTGAHLSPQLSKEDSEKIAAVALPASGTLFPDQLWALEANRTYRLAMRSLFNQSVFAPNEGAKNLARLRMAQIYLREGFLVESLGLLDNIRRSSPSYYRSAKLSAMHGAANFLLYRFNDAARDFGAAELNDNPEVIYWRDMLADLLGNPDKSYDFMALNKDYISHYPAIFRQRLAIVAADRMIAAKEYDAALKIFDTLAKDNIIEPIQPYVDFLTAKISADNGQEQEAVDVWKRLAEDNSNKFVQARATFSAIIGQMDNNLLTRDQAIDKLERLRLSWHGDGLELQVVQMLGDMYFDKQDYVNAMRVWQIGVTGFRNTGPAIEMARKMEDSFTKLFSEGVADKMTPLEALALYYEYRNYSPTGLIGLQMIEKLADRLVGVDLLTTAAQLLEQQMRTQMEKSERSRIGAKLADIYLMNNQPKKAVKALQDSVYGDNPILQRLQRNQLAARAMMQMNRLDEALLVLGQDEGVEAEKLRAMIHWEQKDWGAVGNNIESVFKKRPDPSKLMDAEEGEFVLRLALAYIFQGDMQQLQYMRDYFGPLLRGNPARKAFEFITTPDVTLTTRNFDDLLQSLSKTRGFVDGYKARIELAAGADETPVKKQP